MLFDQNGEKDIREARHRADGQINAARENDQRHPDRDEAEAGVADEKIGDVPDGGKVFVAVAPAGGDEQQEENAGRHQLRQALAEGGVHAAALRRRPPNQRRVVSDCSRHTRMMSTALGTGATAEGTWS